MSGQLSSWLGVSLVCLPYASLVTDGPARARQEICARIERIGGRVEARPGAANQTLKISFERKRLAPSDIFLLKGLEGLEELSIEGCNLTDRALTTLGDLSELRVLSLRYMDIGALDFVRNLKKLRKLVLFKTNLSEGALAAVKEAADLSDLSLYASSVSDRDIAHLENLAKLTVLSVGATKVTSEGLKVLNPRLTELDLSKTGASDQSLVFLRRLPNLHALDLADTSVTGTGLGYLRELRKLRSLRVDRCRLDADGLKALGKLERLTELHIEGTAVVSPTGTHPMDNSTLVCLVTLKKLESLFAGATQISDIRKLLVLSELKSLGLSSTKITDDGLGALAGFRRLEVLDLSNTPIADAGVVRLGTAATGLRSLNLSWNRRISDSSVRYLKRLQGLEDLGLMVTKVSDKSLSAFLGMKSLKNLDIRYTYVSQKACDTLRRVRPELSVGFLPGQNLDSYDFPLENDESAND